MFLYVDGSYTPWRWIMFQAKLSQSFLTHFVYRIQLLELLVCDYLLLWSNDGSFDHRKYKSLDPALYIIKICKMARTSVVCYPVAFRILLGISSDVALCMQYCLKSG